MTILTPARPVNDVAFRAAARHTRLVRRLRWLLPAASLLAASLFVGVSYVRSLLAVIDIGPIELEGSKLVLQKPKIGGFDKFKRAYQVTAETAKQDVTSPKKVEMSGIEAQIELVNNGSAKLTSERGLFDGEKEIVRLEGNIRVTSTLGYEMRLKEAIIDMKASEMNSEKPVEVVQGETRITADRLKVGESGSLIRFEGHVRAQIQMPEQPSP